MSHSERRVTWMGDMVEAVRRVVVFGRGGSTPERPKKKLRRPSRRRGTPGIDKRSAQVRKLAAAGVARHEIARRTRLSHDAVTMLMNLARAESAESSGQGTFFRILQSRIAA